MKKKLIYSEIFPYDVIAYVDKAKEVLLYIVVRSPKEPQDEKLYMQVIDIEKFLEYPETISNHHPMRADASHCLGEVFSSYYRIPTKKELEEVKQKILRKRMDLLSEIENLANQSNLLKIAINEN
jgi:hypothetical protein